MRFSYEEFSQLVIKDGRAHCKWCKSWAGISGFYKKASCVNQKKQSSKQHLSMASASTPDSWFLPLVPVLAFAQ